MEKDILGLNCTRTNSLGLNIADLLCDDSVISCHEYSGRVYKAATNLTVWPFLATQGASAEQFQCSQPDRQPPPAVPRQPDH